MKLNPGTVEYSNLTMRDCIRAAYRVRDFQIQGPPWIDSLRYEITAKLPSGARPDQVPEMLQSLLAERFNLVLRRDSKEQSVYVLSAGSGAPRLKPAEVASEPPSATAVGPDGLPRAPMMFSFPGSGVHVLARAASVAAFAELLSRFTARPVVDLTGIKGLYDFETTFFPEVTPPSIASARASAGLPVPSAVASSPDAAPEPVPSLSDAVKQYGFKLERRMAPIDMLTVVSAEKTPASN